MIVFEKVKYKNLLSVGTVPIEVSLNEHKNTLVVGPNGQGKSILLDAICFSLFGKPYRKINKPQLINSINGKDMLVEIEFTIGSNAYVIRRGMKPNIFEIFANGVLINQDSATRDYQQYLEQNILKIDYKSFLQIVILGSANFVPFMQLPALHRREIIEELLDIQVFSVMNNLLKDHVQDNRNSLTTAEHGLTILRTKLEMIKKHENVVREMKERELNSTERTIDSHKASISIIETDMKLDQEELDKLKNSRYSLNRVRNNRDGMIKNRSDTDKKHKKLLKKIEELMSSPVCPSCGQNMKQDVVQQQTDEAWKQAEQCVEAIRKFDAALAEYDGLDDMIVDNQDKIATIESRIAKREVDISHHVSNIANLTIKLKEIKSELEAKHSEEAGEIRKQIKIAENQKSTILVDQEVLQICSILLKDGGIKARIIAQYIPVINKLINKYLTAMDFFVQFELDTSFNETIKSRYRDDFSYESFSEGEKTRIDLALLFAWRALAKLRNSMSTNLLVFDEILDSSLDSTGMDDLLKIIEQLTGETNVIVISHRDAMFDRFTNIMRFEKVKNFTRLVS